ncbi:MAG: 50S ribosomal protein L15 [Bacteroidales bacterium]|nr:50S ribosomal protein L15 [Bacteroidales bacterium]
MDLSNLTPAKGSTKNRKRIARGQGSGRGGTSTRGHKGAKSRSGYSKKIGFEGGQMSLTRRVPKFGFKNRNRVEYKPINLSVIEKLATDKNLELITFEILREASLVAKNDKVKILGNGEITKKVTVHAHAFSKSAKEAIEKLGAEAVLI